MGIIGTLRPPSGVNRLEPVSRLRICAAAGVREAVYRSVERGDAAKQGRFDEGIARYHQALRLQPDNAAIHFHLADALAAHDQRPEALVSLREAIRLRPAFWEARYLLGVELAFQGKIQEAQDQFSE